MNDVYFLLFTKKYFLNVGSYRWFLKGGIKANIVHVNCYVLIKMYVRKNKTITSSITKSCNNTIIENFHF